MHVLYVGQARSAFIGGEWVEVVPGRKYGGRFAEELAEAYPAEVRKCDERGAVARIAAPVDECRPLDAKS